MCDCPCHGEPVSDCECNVYADCDANPDDCPDTYAVTHAFTDTDSDPRPHVG